MCLKADSHELRLTRAFVADSCIATAEIRNFQFWAGALVWWLWEETHILKVVGSNPAPYTGWTFFTYCKNCNVCLKRPKINEKEAGVGPFF